MGKRSMYDKAAEKKRKQGSKHSWLLCGPCVGHVWGCGPYVGLWAKCDPCVGQVWRKMSGLCFDFGTFAKICGLLDLETDPTFVDEERQNYE